LFRSNVWVFNDDLLSLKQTLCAYLITLYFLVTLSLNVEKDNKNPEKDNKKLYLATTKDDFFCFGYGKVT